ncbi:hypothetical protein F4677DRAFT_338342 [Hypoxylon crocopeplum]|nr:hypothetical protein F4677DRAFT_338342 [Hypoxylon crocopeplum]
MSSLNHHGMELDGLLDKYLPQNGSSKPCRLLAALKSIAADIKIKSAMGNIEKFLPLLTTFLLTSVAFRNEVALNQPKRLGIRMEPDRNQSSSGAAYHVSRHEVRHFVDRPEMLDEIDRVLGDERSQLPRIAILQGMGGQGKTQLALRYCGIARSQRNLDYILWIDASTRVSTMRGLEEISEELSENNQGFEDSDARITFVRRKLTSRNLSWLLVFDNYDDPATFDLREYIPKGPLGYVLITTRNPVAERIGPLIRVTEMTESEAMNLLFKQLDAAEDETNRNAAVDIVRRLGCLPLAIDQAAAYIKAEGLPLADFLSHYEQSARDILESIPRLWEYNESAPIRNGEESGDAVAKTVFTTWNLSLTLLRPDTHLGTLKVAILSLIAFFDPHEISEEHLKTYYYANNPDQQPEWMYLFIDDRQQWSNIKFDKVMREFLRLSLITSLNTERKSSDFAFVSLHPLVGDWINLRQNSDIYRSNFERFTRLLAANLSSKFWEDPLDPSFFECKMSLAQRHQMEGHIASWMNLFMQMRPNLRPTMVDLGREGPVAVTAAELLIAQFLTTLEIFDENGLELLQWLWDVCNVVDDQMLPIKFGAGSLEVNWLCILPGLTEEAKKKGRERWQYWRTTPGTSGNDIIHTGLLQFLTALTFTDSMKDEREIIDLCKSELETLPNVERNMTIRHQLLAFILLAANRLGEFDVYDMMFDTIWNETAERGGDDFRRRIWPYHCWFFFTIYCLGRTCDSDFKVQFSHAAVEWATDKYGLYHYRTIHFRILKANALCMAGRLADAKAMAQDCIAIIISEGYGSYTYARAHVTLGEVLMKQEEYEEAYNAYNLVLQVQGYLSQNERLQILERCGDAAKRVNIGLADAYYTMRLSGLNDTDNCHEIINSTMDSWGIKLRYGTQKARQETLELLADGLGVYGIEIIYHKDGTPQRCLRESIATINLGDPDLSRRLTEDGTVHTALLERFGMWYGFDLLIRMAVQLLQMENIDTAEQAFHLAKTTFEKVRGPSEIDIASFIGAVFSYSEIRFEIDYDRKRLQDISAWARIQILEKRGEGMEDLESWWEDKTTELLSLMELYMEETKSQWGTRIRSKTIGKLSNMFSRVASLKPPRSSPSQPSSSLQRGLGFAHNIATSSVGPAVVELQDRSTLAHSQA